LVNKTKGETRSPFVQQVKETGNWIRTDWIYLKLKEYLSQASSIEFRVSPIERKRLTLGDNFFQASSWKRRSHLLSKLQAEQFAFDPRKTGVSMKND
jgi:hypothetical protein